MRIVNTAVTLTVTLALTWAVAGCGASTGTGDDTKAFCKLAATSSQSRNEAQVNAYYDQLKKVAAKDLVSDIATLRSGWRSVSFAFGDLVNGNVQKVSRPPAVSKAAKNVLRVVSQKCGVKGGVYVVLPQSGF
jgi:hypothetical protein